MKLLKTLIACMSHEVSLHQTILPNHHDKLHVLHQMHPPIGSNLLTGLWIALLITSTATLLEANLKQISNSIKETIEATIKCIYRVYCITEETCNKYIKNAKQIL
jgi:H+/gluconate symporter-like permease